VNAAATPTSEDRAPVASAPPSPLQSPAASENRAEPAPPPAPDQTSEALAAGEPSAGVTMPAPSSAPADEPSPRAGTGAGAEAPPETDPVAGVAEGGEAAPEENPRLEEVLQELEEEMETHAIGQEPEVRVEDELDSSTLQEIGIPKGSAPPVPAAQEPASGQNASAGSWIGNRRKMIAHPPGTTKPLPMGENRVEFASREEAEKAGYVIAEGE